MKEKLNPLLAVAAVSLLPWPVTIAAAQSGATLTVEVRPEARIEAPSSLAWAAGASTVPIPLNIKVRLNPGTYAALTIARLEQGESTENSLDSPRQAVLEVEGKTGWQVLSVTPVAVRNYFRSGIHGEPLVVRLASPLPGASHPVSLRVRLSFSDGSVERAQTIQLHVESSLVSQAPSPLAP